MEWIILGIVILGAGFLYIMKLSSLVSEARAREFLRSGAKVIDVRTATEFQSGHLPPAINLPVNELDQRIGEQVSDKDTVLLLHCLKGGRSAIGRRMLKQLGYTSVWNLGSYSRAERIVRGTE